MKKLEDIKILVASAKHVKYVDDINDAIDLASKQRGTGIARRTFEYLQGKMLDGKAIIALDEDKFAGFCYIETWENKNFVANSGLIVRDEYRGLGLAKAMFLLINSPAPSTPAFLINFLLFIIILN